MKITNLNKDMSTNFQEEFANDILIGLCSKIKFIPSKYFYDEKGSELFQKITNQNEYYLTKKEYQILEANAAEISDGIEDAELDLIELGAGDGHKSQIIIKGLLNSGKKVNYYPVDISEEALNQLKLNLIKHDNLSVHGIVGEYIQGLKFLKTISTKRQFVLFLGSNIGNFDRVKNQVFFKQLWRAMGDHDYLLTGFDLKKSPPVMIRAYNDSNNVTRDFNLNLLSRINTELGANFQIHNFEHFGTYNPILGAMESYLISRKAQDVYISELSRTFDFEENEPIHLEYSFKFSTTDINYLAKQTGCNVIKHYSDEENFFIDSLWQVKKEHRS